MKLADAQPFQIPEDNFAQNGKETECQVAQTVIVVLFSRVPSPGEALAEKFLCPSWTVHFLWPNPHRTRDVTRNAMQANGTC